MSAEERKKEAAWFDVGIIKGTSCTVSSYYLPNGELEKTEIDVEVQLHLQLGLNQCCGSKLFTAEPNCQLRDEADFACGCEIFSSGDPDPYGSL